PRRNTAGKTCSAFIADMVPPPSEVKDRSEVWQRCAERYGRHWKEVRDSIQNKRSLYQQKDFEWITKRWKLHKQKKKQENQRRIK
ncbi:hypothetical protein ABEV55_19355, partial [Aneurinibacillus thermoaerophilus]